MLVYVKTIVFLCFWQKKQTEKETFSDGSHETEEKQFEFQRHETTSRGFGSSQMVCLFSTYIYDRLFQNKTISTSDDDSVAVCDEESLPESHFVLDLTKDSETEVRILPFFQYTL